MADVADMQREAERRRSFGLGEKQRRRVEMFIAFRAGPDRRQRDHMRQVQGADRRLPDIGVAMAGHAAHPRLDRVDAPRDSVQVPALNELIDPPELPGGDPRIWYPHLPDGASSSLAATLCAKLLAR